VRKRTKKLDHSVYFLTKEKMEIEGVNPKKSLPILSKAIRMKRMGWKS